MAGLRPGSSDTDRCRNEILISQVVLDQTDDTVAGYVVFAHSGASAPEAAGPAPASARPSGPKRG